jgi:hypothetical protein
LVKNAQPYCGLEIDIIAISPSRSCTHRVDVVADEACDDTPLIVVIFAPM